MRVYLGLGANRAPRAARLRAAVAALPTAGVAVRRVSSLIETAPVGMSSRRKFLNCVIEGETELRPRQLLGRLARLERAAGRRRAGGRPGTPQPRGLDLDILLLGRVRLRRAGLEIPHPRLATRGFVLCGLAELAPHLRLPGTALTMQRLLKRLQLS